MVGWTPLVRSMRLNSLSLSCRCPRLMHRSVVKGRNVHILYHFTFFAVTVRSVGLAIICT